MGGIRCSQAEPLGSTHRKNQPIAQFAHEAMLSHEFRNPLAAIDRSAQMIQIKAPKLMPPEAQRLSQIRANAATLSGFVDNFLLVEMLGHKGVAAASMYT